MENMFDFSIWPADPLSVAALSLGQPAFIGFAKYAGTLPYRRVINDADPLAVLEERCGTCSSKHKLLAALAHECGIPVTGIQIPSRWRSSEYVDRRRNSKDKQWAES
jgi:hypothetical protein